MAAEVFGGDFVERHRSLEGRLRSFSDPQARLAWVVERAAQAAAVPEGLRRPANEVKGCASRLWLQASLEEGRCRFRADSESAILKAFVSLLCELYDGLDPTEVRAHEPGFLRTTGLETQLTENRRRTLERVRQAMCEFAVSVTSGQVIGTARTGAGDETFRRP